MPQNAPSRSPETPSAPPPGEGDSNLSGEQPQLFYGFFHTTCIHESSPALISTHLTKAGAWRAMWQYAWNAWIEAHAEERIRDKGRILVGVDRHWKKALIGERSSIKVVEVAPEAPRAPRQRLPLPG